MSSPVHFICLLHHAGSEVILFKSYCLDTQTDQLLHVDHKKWSVINLVYKTPWISLLYIADTRHIVSQCRSLLVWKDSDYHRQQHKTDHY